MSTSSTADFRAALRAASSDLLAYFERRVASREDAADLLADTLLTAWRRVDCLPDSVERQRMWLFAIAANHLSNHRRSLSRRNALADRLRQHVATSTGTFDGDEQLAVRDAVLRLPAAQRELVTLVHWDGFSIAEAAEILGVNASTARSRYAAGKTALVETLEGTRIS